MSVDSVTVTLQVIADRDLAAAIGDDRSVGDIADRAMDAAFRVIADELGEPYGDLAPEEVADLDRVFALFVRAMCVNQRRGAI